MRRVSLAIAAALSIADLDCSGCASSSPQAELDGGDAAPAPSADAPLSADAPGTVDSASAPGIPAGWVPFPDYDPSCGFYVPSSKAVLPPPVSWEACGPTPSPTGLACEQ